jgi:hypothetical protein
MKQLLISVIAMFGFTMALASEPTKTPTQSTDSKPAAAAKPEMKLAKKKEDKKTNSTKGSDNKSEKPAVK